MADFTSTTSFHLTSLPKAPSRVKFVEPFPLSSAGLNAGGHQFGNKNYKHGPRPKGRGLVLQRRNDAQRHSSRENPNVFMPEGASQVFRKQNSRRTLWLLEAEMKGASPEKASTLSTLMAQQQNRLGKLSRKHRRGKEGKRGSSRLRNPLQGISNPQLLGHQ